MGKVKKSNGSRISHPYASKGQTESSSEKSLDNSSEKSSKTLKKDAISIAKSELKPKSKKRKIKEKSQKWKDKMENLRKAKEEEAAKAKREKTKITGDLKPLSDELTSIFSNIMADKKININFQQPLKENNSSSYNPFLSNVDHFRSVLSNKNFKDNPLSAVKSHILRTNAMYK